MVFFLSFMLGLGQYLMCNTQFKTLLDKIFLKSYFLIAVFDG